MTSSSKTSSANSRHQADAVGVQTIEFVVVFWGAKYRDFFIQFCLPSLLAPHNIPYFSTADAANIRGRLIICSTGDDYDVISRNPLFARLSPHIEVEFIDLGWPPRDVHPQLHM